jgi:hypothetical protein
LAGCATLKEAARGFAGISTKALEENRKDALKKDFPYDYKTCYDKAKKFISESESYIYDEDAGKKMIAIYLSEEDTTPVGIFFKEITSNSTQVEVSSASTFAKEFIAGKLFKALAPLK